MFAGFGGDRDLRFDITYQWQVLAVTGAVTIAMAVDDILDLDWLASSPSRWASVSSTVLVGITITTIAIRERAPSVWSWLSRRR